MAKHDQGLLPSLQLTCPLAYVPLSRSSVREYWTSTRKRACDKKLSHAFWTQVLLRPLREKSRHSCSRPENTMYELRDVFSPGSTRPPRLTLRCLQHRVTHRSRSDSYRLKHVPYALASLSSLCVIVPKLSPPTLSGANSRNSVLPGTPSFPVSLGVIMRIVQKWGNTDKPACQWLEQLLDNRQHPRPFIVYTQSCRRESGRRPNHSSNWSMSLPHPLYLARS